MGALLVRQVEAALEGLDLALEACDHPDRIPSIDEAMVHVEHTGDRARLALVRAISQQVSTPLDREDLFRASRSIDDVLDNTRDFVRETHLWNARPDPATRDALEHVRSALLTIKWALGTARPLVDKQTCIDARKEVGKVRDAYEEGLARVFNAELSMETLKSRELLRRVDVIGLRLTEAVDAILDGIVKRTA